MKDMKKQKFVTIIFILVVVNVFTALSCLFLELFFRNEINKKTRDKRVPIEINADSLDKTLTFSVYPWSKYKKGSLSKPDEEQKSFLREKELAECIVDLVNYDGQLISDKENAKEILYHELRVLNAEGRKFYVLYQVKVEEVFVFAMIDMEGKLFSFHYVTDCEYQDGGDTIKYVMEQYAQSGKIHSLDENVSEFYLNKNLFITNMTNTLELYNNMYVKSVINEITLYTLPDKTTDESGSIMLEYTLVPTDNQYIYFYIDKQSKKFSGYHIGIKR